MTQSALSHPNKLSQLVGGLLKEISVTKAASATTNYTAGDVISESCTAGSTTVAGTAWTFAEVARENAGSGLIVKAQVLIETATNASVPKLSLYLFNETPSCMLSDNIANTALLYADEASYVGVIKFPALSRLGTGSPETIVVPGASSTSVGISCNIPLAFRCASAADDLYGVLVTADNITGEKATDDFIVKLAILQY